MGRSRIEWLRDPISGKQGYTINPVKGLCPVACDYCYARRMYKRFKWNPEIRYERPLMYIEPFNIKLPSKIFIGSTMELFGDWIKKEWLEHIFETVRYYKEHTFIFLTKRPERLPKEFPNNCWVGVSVIDLLDKEGRTPLHPMVGIKAKVKFVSFEPLLNSGSVPRPDALAKSFEVAGINWVIIGQQTPVRKTTMPKIEWIREIVEAADKAGVPVFLKYNLVGTIPIEEPFYGHNEQGWFIRQEFPNLKNILGVKS